MFTALILMNVSAMATSLLPVVLLGALVVWSILLYNRLVLSRNRTREAWSGIDVQLKRRSSLIPNLVESVRGYTNHEHSVFTEVAEARSSLRISLGWSTTAKEIAHAAEILTRVWRRVASAEPAVEPTASVAGVADVVKFCDWPFVTRVPPLRTS